MAADPAADVRPIVLAITGASGAVYAARLLQTLLSRRIPVHLTISDSGAAVIRQELGVECSGIGSPQPAGSVRHGETQILQLLAASDRLLGLTGDPPQPSAKLPVGSTAATERAIRDQLLTIHHHKNYFTPIASGSFLTAGMIVCPCSGSTLSGIAHAASQNLIQRAAEVHLKEHRKLIVVPRETPLSVLQLENMHRLAQAGAVVLPAAPGWYHGASRLQDLVDFIVGRILDQLGIENHAVARWASEPP